MDSVVTDFLNLSSEYIMSQVATAAVVENRLDPITRTEPGQQLVVTGQYLYENFMQANESDKTRMGLIRQLVDTADALQIKGACDKMVELARLQDYPVELYPEGKPKKAERKTKEQQAMNVRTIVQSSWGALKFARSAADQAGYDDTTGYLAMRVIAQKALATAKVDWKGEALRTDADKERAKLQKEQRAETTALVDVQKDNPRLVGESLADWNTRTFAIAETEMEKAKETAEQTVIDELFAKLLEKHGEARLIALAGKICTEFDLDLSEQDEGEPTEQETLDAMAGVSEELANA